MTHRAQHIARRLFLRGLLAVGCGMSATAALAQSDPVGVVIRQAGIVTVLRGAVPGTLNAGDGVFRGDRVVTGPDARLRIAFDDGSTVTIGPQTDVTISKFVFDDDGSVTDAILNLVRGILRTSLVPSTNRERFEIRTRTAVASVRSTDWIVEAKDADCAVFVVSGRVAVSAVESDATVMLEPDFGTDILNGAPPTAPKRWGLNRVSRALSLTDGG